MKRKEDNLTVKQKHKQKTITKKWFDIIKGGKTEREIKLTSYRGRRWLNGQRNKQKQCKETNRNSTKKQTETEQETNNKKKLQL